MKFFYYFLFSSYLIPFNFVADALDVRVALESIHGRKTSKESRSFLLLYDQIVYPDWLAVCQKALDTGNVDLLSLLDKWVRDANWSNVTTWEDGLDFQVSFAFEAMGKWHTPGFKSFREYFDKSPDVPYDRGLGDWHVGFMYRGLQGEILQSMARFDPETFRSIVLKLKEGTYSNSRRRTIVWAMRHFEIDFSIRVLSNLSKQGDALGSDARDSLRVLQLRKHRRDLLKSITSVEQTAQSKELRDLGNVLNENEWSDVVERAAVTGNPDLLALVEERLEAVSWNKNLTWSGGLDFYDKFFSLFEAIAKWKSPGVKTFRNHFDISPDVPYEDGINSSDYGYDYRGLQGGILELIARHDPESFRTIALSLNAAATSESRKRTIVWAMRFSDLHFCKPILANLAGKSGGLAIEAKASLDALEKPHKD